MVELKKSTRCKCKLLSSLISLSICQFEKTILYFHICQTVVLFRDQLCLKCPLERGKRLLCFHSSSRIIGSSDRPKLVYCSRTVPEIEKTLAELKRLLSMLNRKPEILFNFLGLDFLHVKICVSILK